LANLDLIANQDTSATGFQHILERLRSKESSAPTLEEITKDIELVRSKHYAKKSDQDYIRYKSLDQFFSQKRLFPAWFFVVF